MKKIKGNLRRQTTCETLIPFLMMCLYMEFFFEGSIWFQKPKENILLIL